MARVGGYCGAAFKGAQGVMQVYPLSPTIFNVVMDAVVRHWVAVMAEGVKERGECGQEGRHHNAVFYADNGMVVSSDRKWLQVAFITLVGLLDEVGLWTNVGNKFGMFC